MSANTFSIRKKGEAFYRYGRALVMAGGDPHMAIGTAATLYGEGGEIEAIAKAAATVKAGVGAMSTPNGITSFDYAANGFIEDTAPRTILGKFANLRAIPPRTRVAVKTGAGKAVWKAEGASIPVSRAAFENIDLDVFGLAGIVIATAEVGRGSDPRLEVIMQTDLQRAVIRAMDEAAVSNAAATAVQPAGLAHGATTISWTGDATDDFEALFDAFEGDLEQSYLVMSPRVAVRLSGADHPNLSARGGACFGLPTITSKALNADSAGGRVLLIDPSQVAFVDGGVSLLGSSQGTVELSDAPTNNSVTPVGTNQVSLYQTNSTALRITRYLNWQAAPGAVAVLEGVP